MTDQVKLNELQNSLRITGTVKEVNLEIKPLKQQDNTVVNTVRGNLVITSIIDNKVNEHRVNLFAKETSKLYKGYVTVMREYKVGDKVTITGSIDANDYLREGQLVEGNRIRGLFVNRQDDPNVKDEAVATVEVVVTGIYPKFDSDGLETGEYDIHVFTVGNQGNSVIPIHNVIVGSDLANVLLDNYEVGSTGKFTLEINNYAEVEQKEQPDFDNSGGFGIQIDVGNEVKNWTRNFKIIGGSLPYGEGKKLTDEQIAVAKQIRALHVQEVVNRVPATPPRAVNNNVGGFGVDAGIVDISDDDLPF